MRKKEGKKEEKERKKEREREKKRKRKEEEGGRKKEKEKIEEISIMFFRNVHSRNACTLIISVLIEEIINQLIVLCIHNGI